MCFGDVINRRLLYFNGCVPIRLILGVLILSDANPMLFGIPVFSMLALFIALGFVRTHVRQVMVGFFGGRVWWHNLRIFHATMWFCASMLINIEMKLLAGALVIMDIIPGFVLSHHSDILLPRSHVDVA